MLVHFQDLSCLFELVLFGFTALGLDMAELREGVLELAGEALSVGTVLGEGIVCFPKARATARAILRELMETGKVRPVIDKRYRLSEVPEATRYLEQVHTRGK